MTSTTYHIRRKLRASRSTSIRLDESDRGRGNFCGAVETSEDIAWTSKPETVTVPRKETSLAIVDGKIVETVTEYTLKKNPCAECAKLAAEFKASRRS